MPRISPQQLFKEKQVQLQREEQEKDAQISVQKNEQQSAQLFAQDNAQKSARTVEQESEQNNSFNVVNVDKNKQLNYKEKSTTISNTISNDSENSDFIAKLHKLADKVSLSDVQSELFRDRTILPRTSYTLSDEIVEVVNSFYLVLKKKDKRLSKQDVAEVILRQFFKDSLKVNKSKNGN
jgi:hypothetical protein